MVEQRASRLAAQEERKSNGRQTYRTDTVGIQLSLADHGAVETSVCKLDKEVLRQKYSE